MRNKSQEKQPLEEKRLQDLILNVLSNLYNSFCDCRKEYKMPINMDYRFHSEDCPYRIKCEYTEIKELFNNGE